MKIIEKRKQMRGQGGFTLIELLVVVAILAILAGVVLFAVGNLTEDADLNACKVERDTIKTAIAAAAATTDRDTDGDGVVDPDTAEDYLDIPPAPKYFSGSGATWTKVAGAPAACPAV